MWKTINNKRVLHVSISYNNNNYYITVENCLCCPVFLVFVYPMHHIFAAKKMKNLICVVTPPPPSQEIYSMRINHNKNHYDSLTDNCSVKIQVISTHIAYTITDNEGCVNVRCNHEDTFRCRRHVCRDKDTL